VITSSQPPSYWSSCSNTPFDHDDENTPFDMDLLYRAASCNADRRPVATHRVVVDVNNDDDDYDSCDFCQLMHHTAKYINNVSRGGGGGEEDELNDKFHNLFQQICSTIQWLYEQIEMIFKLPAVASSQLAHINNIVYHLIIFNIYTLVAK